MKLPEKCLQASSWCGHPVQLAIRRVVTHFWYSSGMVWKVLIPCPHKFGLSCSLCLPTPAPRLPFYCASTAACPWNLPKNQTSWKIIVLLLFILASYFSGRAVFCTVCHLGTQNIFFLAQERQESQGWKTRMVWEALLLKHSLGRVKQLFDDLCSCGYPVSSTRVWSFRAPSVDCSTMPGTHWGNVSLLWPPVWVLRIFFYGLHLMDFQLPWSRGWVKKVISHSKQHGLRHQLLMRGIFCNQHIFSHVFTYSFIKLQHNPRAGHPAYYREKGDGSSGKSYQPCVTPCQRTLQK